MCFAQKQCGPRGVNLQWHISAFPKWYFAGISSSQEVSKHLVAVWFKLTQNIILKKKVVLQRGKSAFWPALTDSPVSAQKNQARVTSFYFSLITLHNCKNKGVACLLDFIWLIWICPPFSISRISSQSVKFFSNIIAENAKGSHLFYSFTAARLPLEIYVLLSCFTALLETLVISSRQEQ